MIFLYHHLKFGFEKRRKDLFHFSINEKVTGDNLQVSTHLIKGTLKN